jgi:hypothetical protein
VPYRNYAKELIEPEESSDRIVNCPLLVDLNGSNVVLQSIDRYRSNLIQDYASCIATYFNLWPKNNGPSALRCRRNDDY